MDDKINITIRYANQNEELNTEIQHDFELLEKADKAKIKVLYNDALVTNVKYVGREVVCANCGASRHNFNFITHVLYEEIEKEIYKCAQCGQRIVTNYPRKEIAEKTFK
jgi:DNA-directed RNA polymerase subunit RPC12/RpoP